ncbi:hypothetical protein [Tardiphaga sp.]|uniref:hypothetical protein n=1 Tax=Tardiphaga sp. TaxID=1926292 RepID=UPI00262A77FF|nr:hypothetical protein [Tardiphaga sp.]MDB5617442.1 hypothetical protein [Tardiphaga sp.]
MTEQHHPTWAEINAIISQSTPGRIQLQMAFASSHQERRKLVEDAIDWIAQEMTKTSHLRQERGEDEISIDFVSMLKAMGFQAAHDTQYGGHCDVIVEGRDDFLWIAEAKVHSSYAWLEKGMAQLSTRYSTGLDGQDCGEILVYTYQRRLDHIMLEWADRLKAAVSGIQIDQIDMDKLTFLSVHEHENTGRPFRIRHKGVTLHFAPTA